jgi:hypothetical protein
MVVQLRHVERIEVMRNVYTILVEKLGGRRQLGRPGK